MSAVFHSVGFARAGETAIVFQARYARMNRFSAFPNVYTLCDHVAHIRDLIR